MLHVPSWHHLQSLAREVQVGRSVFLSYLLSLTFEKYSIAFNKKKLGYAISNSEQYKGQLSVLSDNLSLFSGIFLKLLKVRQELIIHQ